MENLNKNIYDLLQNIFYNTTYGQVLESLTHLADYAICFVFFIIIMIVLWEEKQYNKLSMWLCFSLAILFITEVTKMVLGLKAPNYDVELIHDHNSRVLTIKAIFLYISSASVVNRGKKYVNILFAIIVCSLMCLGRIYTGDNYTYEIIFAICFVTPLLIIYNRINNRLEEMFPPKRRSQDTQVMIEQALSDEFRHPLG